MYIVLDANVIISNYRLDSIVFKLILDNLKKQGHIVCIPELVYMEVINNFKEVFKDRKNKAHKSLNQLELVTGETYTFKTKVNNIEDATKSYEKYLAGLTKKYSGLKIDFPSLPEVPHKDIAFRAIKKQKPFTKGEKGYRDTLIWFSLLQLAKDTGEKVVFVLDNYKDFAIGEDQKDVFHSILIEELKENGLQSNVFLVDSLDSFFRQYIYPYLPKAKQAIARLLKASDKYKSFKALFSDYLINHVDISELRFTEYEEEGACLEEILRINNVKVISVVEQDEEDVVIDVEVMMTCRIHYYVERSLSDPYFNKKMFELNVVEHTDYGMWIEAESKTALYAYLAIDMNLGKISGMDIAMLEW